MMLLFCNIGWMQYYNGETVADAMRSTAVTPSKEKKGCYNFQDYNGFCYGDMDVIPQIDSESRDDVTVLWVSQDEYESAPVIVGWYKQATIYRTEQVEPDKYCIGRELHYYAKAKSEDAFLLPVGERNFVVIEEAKSDPQFLSMILNYIDNTTIQPANLRLTEENVSRILQNPGMNYDELMEAGDNAVDDEEYYKALIYYNTAFHTRKSIDAIFNIASMLEVLFCFDKAIPIFEKLRELEGDEPDTLDNLMYLYLQTKQYEPAMEICNLLIDQAEETEEVCGLLCVKADIFTRFHQIDKAVECLNFIIEHSEDELMVHEATHCRHHLLKPNCACHEHGHTH